MASVPVGAPFGATAAEGRMPMVLGIEATAKQIVRPMGGKVMLMVAAKARILGKVRPIGPNQAVETQTVAKAMVVSAV